MYIANLVFVFETPSRSCLSNGYCRECSNFEKPNKTILQQMKMKEGVWTFKRVVFLLLCSIGLCQSYAQDVATSISGCVLDSATRQPVPFATIGLTAKDKTTTAATVSNIDGSFALSAKKRGDHTLSIVSLGKTPIEIPLKLTGKAINLDSILMADDTQKIEGVDVVGQKQIVKMEPDKLTYSIADDPTSKTLTVLQILRKTPMVSVDGQDNISVNGSSSFKVYVDGKPNQMMTSNPTQVFRAMPASAVKSIEVITDPGARSDAEGGSAILNLKMATSDPSATDGTMGNVRAEVGTREVGGTVYLAMKKNKHTLTADVAVEHMKADGTRSENLTTYNDGSSIESVTTSDVKMPYKMGSLGYSLDIDTLRTLSLDFSASQFKRKQDGHNETIQMNGDELISKYLESSDSENTYNDLSASLDYTRQLPTDKEDNINFSYMFSRDWNKDETDNRYSDIIGAKKESLKDLYQTGTGDNKNHTAMIDLRVTPVKALTILAGGKYTGHRSNSEEDMVTDTTTHSDFEYKYDIGAAYFEGNMKWDKTKLKAGLRYEYTHQKQRTTHEFSKSYGLVVPSMTFSQQLTDRQNIGLTYSVRVRRPSLSQMDPFEDKSDPLRISKGNPDLEYEKTHAFKLSYSLVSQKVMFSFNTTYATRPNGVYNFSRALDDGVILSTYGNIMRRNELNFRIYTALTLSQKTRLMFNVADKYIRVSSHELDKKKTGWTPNAFVNIQQELPGKIQLMAACFANGRDIQLQSRGDVFVGMFGNLSRSFLNDKLNVGVHGFMAADEGGDFVMKNHVEGIGYVSDTKMKWPAKSLSCTLTFNFGSGNINRKTRQHEQEENGSERKSGPSFGV